MGTPMPRWMRRLLRKPLRKKPGTAGVAAAAATRVAAEAAPRRSDADLARLSREDLVKAMRETAAELDAELTASGAVGGDPFAVLLRRLADKLEPKRYPESFLGTVGQLLREDAEAGRIVPRKEPEVEPEEPPS